jgi:hypothetical protein
MDIYELIIEDIIHLPFIFEEETARREWEEKIVDKILKAI